MSDAREDEVPDGKIESQIDPLFAAAFNSVYFPEDEPKAGEGGAEAGAAGAGAQGAAAGDQGAAAAAGNAAAQTAGTLPGAAELGDAHANGSAGSDAAGQAVGAAGGDGAGGPAAEAAAAGDANASAAAAAERGIGEVDATSVDFGAANKAINENMAASFRKQAAEEFRNEIDPQFINTLRSSPFLLVGTEVPDLRPNAQPQDKVKLLDTQMARDYQEALSQQIENEIQSRVDSRTEQVRPLLGVIQESVQMFQNNPDLVVGSKQFDPDLAERFASMASAYEYKLNDKVIGYQVNVQPLINSIRSQLEKERGADGVVQQQAQTARQQQAAAQAREQETGRFSGPQAGIPSTAQQTGAAAEDDMSTFWAGVGMPDVTI